KIDDIVLNSFTTVVDATKCKVYMKNFGEFFNNQVEHANSIILSRTANVTEEKLHNTVRLLRDHNKKATIITTDWAEISGKQILEAMEHKNTLEAELEHLEHEHHHHHHHDHDEECDCGCHEHNHHHDEHCDCHEHHHEHHHHDEHCECGCHGHEHHHHDHDEHCECGCHEHHHHHADEVFISWGAETTNKYTLEELSDILDALDDTAKFGTVLRAKGIVETADEGWIHYDYVPGEKELRQGAAEVIGRICVIGSKLNEENLKRLFRI
ncbi:MAG: GTP-binding protein, partial [Clostridia bacterium]|nr:GTP-binding protein [Clostridia bacterium]